VAAAAAQSSVNPAWLAAVATTLQVRWAARAGQARGARVCAPPAAPLLHSPRWRLRRIELQPLAARYSAPAPGAERCARSRTGLAPPQVPLARCLVLGSTAQLVQAAAAAGAVAVAIPRKLSEQATFPSARAKMDGFGAGAATWRRLSSLLPEQQ
jgi:hypothetical protein